MLELLLGNTLVAAGLAMLVLLFCRVARPGPATRHALWFLVVLKLLSPVGLLWKQTLPFETPRFLADNTEANARPTPIAKPAPVPEPIFAYVVADPNNDETRAIAVRQVDVPIAASQQPSGAPTSVVHFQYTEPGPTLQQTLYLWFLIIWLSGAIVVGARYVQRTLRFARYARSGKEASASLQRQVADLAAMLGVRAPLVRVLPDLPSPVVWCLFRPVLLWPKGLQDQLSADGRRAVLVHELAHLLRKDHWFRWLELAAAVVHWWNPIFWLARRQMRFHAELACDAWVTGTLPDNRRAYAEALLEVCARTTRAAAPSPAVGVGGEGRRDFQRRLTMIMRDRVPCRLAAGAKIFMVLLAIAALPAWTLGQAKPETTPDLEIALSVDKDATQIEDVLVDFDLANIDVGPIHDLDILLPFDFVDAGSPDEQKLKELQARIADLAKQLKAIQDAKAAADKFKKVEGLRYEVVPVKANEERVRILRVGPDGKVIEGSGDPKGATPWVYRAVTASPEQKVWVLSIGPDGKVIESTTAPTPLPKGNVYQYVPVQAYNRIYRTSPDGKTIQVITDSTTTKSAAPAQGIKVEVTIVDGKPQVKVFGADGKEMRIDPATGKLLQSLAPRDQPYRFTVVSPDGKAPHVKVIGADGKEVRDVQILIDQLRFPATRTAPTVQPLPTPGTPVVPPSPAAKPLPPAKPLSAVPAPPISVPAVVPYLPTAVKPISARIEKYEDLRGHLTLTQPVTPPQASGRVVTLTRATYKLPADKAKMLADFLKANIKASVLELKIEGDGLTVTTTPDVQSNIGGIVKLMDGPGGDQLRLRLVAPLQAK